jgi:hypothetical protein
MPQARRGRGFKSSSRPSYFHRERGPARTIATGSQSSIARYRSPPEASWGNLLACALGLRPDFGNSGSRRNGCARRRSQMAQRRSALEGAGHEPDRTKALEEKVRALEDKLNGKWPADVCKFCGERAMRLYHSYPSLGEKGYMREDWKCEKCGKQEPRYFKPATR